MNAIAHQFTGCAALKKGPPVMAIITEVMMAWMLIESAGIDNMDIAGTPLILKLRNIPDSRISTKPFG